MKKVFCILLIALLLLPSVPVSAATTSGYCGEYNNFESVSWDVNTTTGVLTIKGTGPMYSYNATSIPLWCYSDVRDSIKTVIVYPGVTTIADYCFSSLKYVTSITLPAGITEIGRRAFYGCTSLKELIIPDTVQIMYGETFQECPALEKVHLPESLSFLDASTFLGCTALKEINIPQNLEYIGVRCFYGCTSLTSVHIPASVEEIHFGAFAGCTALKDVTFDLAGKLSTLMGQAFYDTAVEKLHLPYFLADIQEAAFSNCSDLSEITLPVYLKKIGNSVFSSCTSLTDIMIPALVTEIGNHVFQRCENLESIRFEGGSRCETIGAYAFTSCTALESIKLPMTITSIGARAFDACTSLRELTVPGLVETVPEGFAASCTALEDVTLPVNLTSIDEYAFYKCENLYSITVPDGLTTVVQCAFYGTDKLMEVYYGGSEDDWKQIDIQSDNKPLENATIHYNNYPYVFDYETMQIKNFMYNVTVRDHGAMFDGGGSIKDALDNSFDRISNVNIYSNSNVLATTSDSIAFVLTGIASYDLILRKDGYRDYIIPTEILRTVLDDCGDVCHNQIAYMVKHSSNKPYVSTVFARQKDSATCHIELQKDTMQIKRGETYEFTVTVGGLASGEVVNEYCIKQENTNFSATSKNGTFEISDLHGKLSTDHPVLVYAKTNKGQTDTVEIYLEKINDSTSDWIDTLADSSEFSFFGKDFMSVTLPESIPFVGGTKLSLSAFEFPFGMKVKGNQMYLSFGFDFFETTSENGGDWKSEWRGVKSTLKNYNKNIQGTKDAWETYKTMKSCKNLADSVSTISKTATSLGFNVGVLGFAEAEINSDGVQFTEVGITLAVSFRASYSVQAIVWVIPCYFTLEGGLKDSGFTVTGIDKTADPDMPLQLHVDLNVNPYIKIAGGVGIKNAISLGPYGQAILNTKYAFTQKHLTMDLTASLGTEWQLGFATGDDTLCEGSFTVLDKYFGDTRASYLLRYASPSQNNDGNAYRVGSSDPAGQWIGNKTSKQYADSAKALQILQKQSDTSASPQIATVGNTTILAFIDNNVLYYATKTGNGTWSNPVAVTSDGFIDMAPTLVSNGNTAVLAWQKICTAVTAANAQTAFLQSTEIYAAEFNTKSNSFSTAKRITADSDYDYLPVPVINGVSYSIYWVSNNGTTLSQSKKNTVQKWQNGTATAVLANENYIVSLAAKGNKLAFVTDADGNLTDPSDLTAVTYTDNTRKALSVKQPMGVIFTNTDADNELLVYTASCLYTADGTCILPEDTDFAGTAVAVSDGSQTKLLWMTQTEDTARIHSVGFENGKWTLPVCIFETESRLQSSAFALKNATVQAVGLVGNNLCHTSVGDFTDIELGTILFDESGVQAGQTATLSVYAQNCGTKPVSTLNFTVSDTLGTNESSTVNTALAVGEGKWFDLSYPIANNFTSTQLTVSANIPDTADRTPDNNKIVQQVGGCDLQFGFVQSGVHDGFCTVTFAVANSGSVAAENVSVILINDLLETMVAKQDIGTLRCDEAATATLYIPMTDLLFEDDGTASVTLLLMSDTDELCDGDNERTVVFRLKMPSTPMFTYGDIDSNGNVEVGDARLALRAAVGLDELTFLELLAGDIDGNDKVEVGDARLILRHAVGFTDANWPS